MPAPIPWSDLEGPCATSRLWPTAAQELKEHKTHLIVTVSDESAPLKRAVLLTQATASIVGTCPEAIGVYWCPASLVVKAAMFRDFAIKALEHGPPLHIWVDFRVGRNEQGTTNGFTKGLAALGLMEIEAENSPEPPGELHDRLMRMAEYLLEQGPVIRDGDTVGDDENQRIRVVYAKPKFDKGEQVMRLEYDAKPAPKPRWKFW
jgi:hypothetical protein